MKLVRLALGAAAALIGLAACGGLPGQPPTPTPGTDDRSLPIADDFSDPSSGWPSRSSTGWTQSYEDGVYRVMLDQDEWTYVLATATAAIDVTDVVIEVDLRFASNYAEAGAGAICRALDQDNYYFFEIKDGAVSIVRFFEDVQTFLVDDEPTQAFDPAGSRLRIECIGDSLAFFVNGEPVASAQDDSLSHGDVGLIAGGAAEGLTDVRFDNFLAWSP
jgi:eukaryotic-like serine/threonine-protein kinase